MSISAAFNNALSGLQASSRATDVVATNISNANTPGYVRRDIEVASSSPSFIGGVTVTGIVRNPDPAILASRREAEASLAYATTISDFLSRLETKVGTPDNSFALTNLLADFEASLLTASSRPDAPERLDAIVLDAQAIVDVVNQTSQDISQARSEADANIDATIARLNATLEEVGYLNTEIAKVNIAGQDDSALQDARQQVIDEIHSFIPVREAQRDNGQVALYSTGGLVLIDGSPRTFEFTPVNRVTPYMTQAGGQLSGLSVNGISIPTSTTESPISGGTLIAEFAVRDELGPDANLQIDALARDLIERFQDPLVDPTLSGTDAGLFTDAGAAFDPVDEVGIAERLSLNASVDPSQGGESWRIRDGINAAIPGPSGQSGLIDALRDTLTGPRTPASGDFGTGALSALDVAGGMLGRIGVQRLSADQSVSFSAITFNEMSQLERANGVDTDEELQRMIQLEQAYAANARMINTVSELYDILLGLGR